MIYICTGRENFTMNVYDFDNTIYDGESCKDMFFYLLKKDLSLLKLVPVVLYAFAKYKRGKITIEKAIEKYAPKIENYFQKKSYLLTDTVEFWDRHMQKIKGFYSVQQRPDDLILTATPEIFMEEVCKSMGVKNYIGTTVDTDVGKITRICLRENKIKAFFENYPDGKIESFYTDSPKNDFPLIEIAENAYVVKGNKIEKIK